MADLYVCKSDELAEGECRLVASGSHHIGVIRADGEFHAFLNVCPHQGGPVCQGLLIHKPEEILSQEKTYHGMRFTNSLNIVCPWHGWEFDLQTGVAIGWNQRKLRKFQVVERDGAIYVSV